MIITQEIYQTLMDDRKELLMDVVDLVKQRDDLLFALNRLLVASPNEPSCIDFHHSKADRHSMIEECGPVKEYMAALANARVVIEAARKGG